MDTQWCVCMSCVLACAYLLLGVDDELSEQLLGDEGDVRGVGEDHLLQAGHAALLVARVMLDVGANHEASQHLILERTIEYMFMVLLHLIYPLFKQELSLETFVNRVCLNKRTYRSWTRPAVYTSSLQKARSKYIDQQEQTQQAESKRMFS